MNIDPPIIPPLLPPPPIRTSHTRVRHYRERYGAHQNNQQNDNPVGTAYTRAYQTQDMVQSHFLDDSDDTVKPSLVQRKLKWVKKICHLVKNKTSKEKLCGPNNQLYGTNDGLHGTDDGLHGTNDGLHGTDDGLHGTNDGLHGTDDGLYGTNNGNSSYNNQTTRSGGRMESGISKRNGHTNGTCTYNYLNISTKFLNIWDTILQNLRKMKKPLCFRQHWVYQIIQQQSKIYWKK
ncbi:uncharacterized protein PGTG_06865 [Puccinia graminis f. sp. tritici CRL 75-36-700-3]|uniref:Uncharacterized protein n=1 Tax=Puccinia graminis f. sp. tritici (strain CRL 75-36-700-3 / race SCCL) TaxID=418459 RepID=E3KA82_PUCGT|nr:uncharacterized protein PGTG_06865 [Puccinia graminis f. sp. tritici CRL 75-36-700-3]EFP81244.1 hypothetical protein PGTG_06865 [Puccinia graminis f. sp. tritici CRL 75-36-700-3]